MNVWMDEWMTERSYSGVLASGSVSGSAFRFLD
jgi:hypothetical protein